MEIIIYEIKCEICGKKKRLKDNPYTETFICPKCKDSIIEPKISDYSDFEEFVVAIENWECKTEKNTTYDYDKNFQKDLFKHFNVKGKKADLAYSMAYEDEHSDGYSAIIRKFEQLIQLIK
jgi:uncharacterized protein YlaI